MEHPARLPRPELVWELSFRVGNPLWLFPICATNCVADNGDPLRTIRHASSPRSANFTARRCAADAGTKALQPAAPQDRKGARPPHRVAGKHAAVRAGTRAPRGTAGGRTDGRATSLAERTRHRSGSDRLDAQRTRNLVRNHPRPRRDADRNHPGRGRDPGAEGCFQQALRSRLRQRRAAGAASDEGPVRSHERTGPWRRRRGLRRRTHAARRRTDARA